MSRSRTGNAIVFVTIVIGVALAIMAVTTDSAISEMRKTKRAIHREDLETAVQATLHRRLRLVEQALAGGAEGVPRRFDPTTTWSEEFVGRTNYGIDYVGGVPVKWTIEPMRTRQSEWVEGEPNGEIRQDSGAGVASVSIPWIQNPKPDPMTPLLPGEQANDTVFLFRIAAEARTAINNVADRAQGVMYVGATKEPLFRYIIFYAAEGAKGDLEMMHDSTLEANGSVHSNGAIYLGGDSMLGNTWSQNRANASVTRIGPDRDGKSVRITGYDGVYRMSKLANMGAINNFGFIPSTALSPDTWYDTTGTADGEGTTNGHYPQPLGTSIADATYDGTVINPFRIRGGSSFDDLATVETNPLARIFNAGTAIEGPIYGVNPDPALPANDGRDRDRAASVWTSDALKSPQQGFGRAVRDRRIGGRKIALPPIMRDRPFEAQRLAYVDVDGDPTTDDHDFARPYFFVDGEPTLTLPSTDDVIEQPGTYLQYVMGPGNAMRRISMSGSTKTTEASALAQTGHNGWDIVQSDGSTAILAETSGLAIRERAVPDLGYMPAQTGTIDGANSVPYAYGKHNQTVRWPLHPIDVTPAAGSVTDAWDGGSWVVQNAYAPRANDTQPTGTDTLTSYGIRKTGERQSYTAGGLLNATVQTGTAPGAFDRSDQASISSQPAGQAEPTWYRSTPGRMFHLQQMTPDTTKSGLLVSVYDDRANLSSRSATHGWRGDNWMGPFFGAPRQTLVTRTAEGWPSGIAGTPVTWPDGGNYDMDTALTGSTDRWSMRFVGFIKPTESKHQFRIKGDDGFRVWIDHKLVLDQWIPQGVDSDTNTPVTGWVDLTPGVWTHICIEYFEATGDNNLLLTWASPTNSTFVGIPASNLCPPAETTGSAGLIARGTGSSGWKSMVMRMRPGTGRTDRRLGATVRPVDRAPGIGSQAPGIPSLLDGKKPYLSFLWSPNRGVFAEYRRDEAYSQRVTANLWFVGRNPLSAADVTGQVGTAPSTLTRASVGTLTPSRVLSQTEQRISDGNAPTSLSRGGANFAAKPPLVVWPLGTADGNTRMAPIGNGTFTVDVDRSQKWRWTKRTQWRFTLDAALGADEVFRWNGTDVFKIKDLNASKVLAAYVNETGASTLRFGTSPTNLTMTTAAPPTGGISWSTTDSPRIIDWDTSSGASTGRWFTVQWVSTGSEKSFSYLTQVQSELDAAKSAVLNATLPTNLTTFVVDRGFTGHLRPVTIKPSAVNLQYTGDTDGFGRKSKARWTVTIGDANTIWYFNDGGSTAKPTINGVQVSSTLFRSDFFGTGRTPVSVADGTLVVISGWNYGDFKDLVKNDMLSPQPTTAELDTLSQASDVQDWLGLNSTVFGGNMAQAELPRTFQLDRSLQVIFDLNSWISQAGTWYTTYPSQILPWNPVQWASLIGSVIPRTGSYRPDMWSGNTIPTRVGVDGATSTSTETTEEGSPRWTTDQPATLPSAPAAIWMRISKTTSGTGMTCEYAFGEAEPTSTGWTTLKDNLGATAIFPLPIEWTDLAMGPIMHSRGNATADSLTSNFDNMRIEFFDDQTTGTAKNVSPTNRLDASDWDASGGSAVPDTDRYLASQYQVFFGPYDITEDFITYRTASGAAILREDWIYNLREFWSQSRWWDDGTEKDSIVRPLPTDGMSNRERLARQTILTVDVAVLQEYLVNRTVADAIVDRMAGGQTTPSGAPTDTLRTLFNGLIYTARTNRYPVNPDLKGPNPFNPLLPNDTSIASLSGLASMDDWLETTAAYRQANWPTARAAWISTQQTDLANASSTTGANGVRLATLQPYVTGNPGGVLTRAPAFAPQQWHHAVRLVNGQDLSWGFTGVTSPPFGTGKTSFVTPNPMYVQGNFNTALKTVIRNGASTPDQSVPCAIMADEITILSNSWTDDPWKRPGMSFVPGTLAYPSAPMTASQTWGTLAINAAGSWVSAPVATSTTVAAAIVVNNQPTTKSTAIIGESAAIASIVNLVENWNPGSLRTFTYIGSIVCLDSKRTTTAFAMGYAKPFGPTPFGHLDRTSGLDWANNDEVKTHSGWWNAYGNRPTNVAGNRWTAPSSGSNTMPSVYGNARRTLIFNPDLLTPEGTPPYAPFGVSVNGIGGWVRSQ